MPLLPRDTERNADCPCCAAGRELRGSVAERLPSLVADAVAALDEPGLRWLIEKTPTELAGQILQDLGVQGAARRRREVNYVFALTRLHARAKHAEPTPLTLALVHGAYREFSARAVRRTETESERPSRTVDHLVPLPAVAEAIDDLIADGAPPSALRVALAASWFAAHVAPRALEALLTHDAVALPQWSPEVPALCEAIERACKALGEIDADADAASWATSELTAEDQDALDAVLPSALDGLGHLIGLAEAAALELGIASEAARAGTAVDVAPVSYAVSRYLLARRRILDAAGLRGEDPTVGFPSLEEAAQRLSAEQVRRDHLLRAQHLTGPADNPDTDALLMKLRSRAAVLASHLETGRPLEPDEEAEATAIAALVDLVAADREGDHIHLVELSAAAGGGLTSEFAPLLVLAGAGLLAEGESLITMQAAEAHDDGPPGSTEITTQPDVPAPASTSAGGAPPEAPPPTAAEPASAADGHDAPSLRTHITPKLERPGAAATTEAVAREAPAQTDAEPEPAAPANLDVPPARAVVAIEPTTNAPDRRAGEPDLRESLPVAPESIGPPPAPP
ncbi:MAG: hypothetical protein AB1416_00280, partial [Actinomycetota bacterium]